MKKVAIIGGSQKSTFQQIGKKNGVDIYFHDGTLKGGKQLKHFQSMIRKSDAVIVIRSACKHSSMYTVKKLAKQYKKPIEFCPSRGANIVIQKAKKLIS